MLLSGLIENSLFSSLSLYSPAFCSSGASTGSSVSHMSQNCVFVFFLLLFVTRTVLPAVLVLFVMFFSVCEISFYSSESSVEAVLTGCEQRKQHIWNVLLLKRSRQRAGSTTHTHTHAHKWGGGCTDTCDHTWHVFTSIFHHSFSPKSWDKVCGSLFKYLYRILL